MRHITIGLLVMSSLAWADVFEYSLKRYPADANTCHEQAKTLGGQFQKASGTKVVQSLCVGEKNTLRDFVIRYESSGELTVVSTLERYFGQNPAGRYKNEADCAADLDAVRVRFEEATDLKSAVAYCTPVEASHNYPWAPRVEGFGEPTLAPFTSGYAIFGVPKDITGKEYRGQVAAALKARGVIYDALVVHSNLAYAQVSVHYYGEDEVDFTLEEPTKTDTKEQCLNQIPQVKAMYPDAATAPALVYCGHVHVGNQYEVNVLYLGDLTLKTRNSVESYKTFPACEADRERLVKFYQKDLGQDVKGGLCTRLVGERTYKVVFFEPR